MKAKHPNPKKTNTGQSTAPIVNLSAAVQNLSRPRAEDVFFDHHKGVYWTPDAYGRWIRYTRDAMRLRLRSTLMLSASPKDGLPAEVDDELDRIAQEKSVEAALPLAGYNAGPHKILGTPVLVTASPEPMTPAKGDHMRFLSRLRRMFGEEQAELFCGWLKFALEDYYEFLHQQSGRNVGMALVVSGTSGLGKTFLVDLLTECFGGRRGEPAQYAKGGTGFNNDLIARELQVFDDDGMGDGYSRRKEVGDFVKRMVAVRDQRCHPKGKDAFMVRVFWRLVFCLNDEAENLQVLPPLERGVKDKVMMLKATGSLLNESEEGRARKDNWQMLVEETSWFIRWLMDDFEIDETLRDTRFGIKAWQHSDLVKGVDSFAPEFRLLDMILERSDLFTDDVWEGTARQLESLLKFSGTPTEREAHDLLKSSGSVGKYLGKLRDKRPDLVQNLQQRDRNGSDCWRITRPGRVENTALTKAPRP